MSDGRLPWQGSNSGTLCQLGAGCLCMERKKLGAKEAGGANDHNPQAHFDGILPVQLLCVPAL